MHPFRDKLVERAIRRFSLQARLTNSKIKSQWHPDIVISRDPGSGGRIVAEKIARKLGWQLLNKRILAKLSCELHIPEKEFAKIDEHNRNWISDSFNMLFNPEYISDILYLKHLKRLLLKHAKEGDVVIVGRGANHIIPSTRCLRVRITAPFEKRVKNAMKYEKKTRVEAEKWVLKIQNKRNNFIKQYFGRKPNDPRYFDLIINTEHIDLQQSRDLIIKAYFAKFPLESRRLKDKL